MSSHNGLPGITDPAALGKQSSICDSGIFEES